MSKPSERWTGLCNCNNYNNMKDEEKNMNKKFIICIK